MKLGTLRFEIYDVKVQKVQKQKFQHKLVIGVWTAHYKQILIIITTHFK